MAIDTAVELSVVIASYNRAGQLRVCMEALSHQTQAPTDFEVIVVVDGSTDGTCGMLADLTTPYRLNVICQEHSGQGAARNRGIDAATGRYCLFLDDDIKADRGLVAEHLRIQREYQGVVGIGQITLTLSSHVDWYAQCFAQGWFSQYEQLNKGLRPLSWMDCYSGNMSAPRAELLKVGGFAVDLPRCEDVELGYRLQRHGLTFVYIPTAIGDQDERKGIREYTADAEKAGIAAVKIYERHPPTLPQLLGSFCEVRPREILLCRILLALNIRPQFPAVIGPLLMKHAWVHTWYRLIYRYCYWRGVRQAVSNHDMWRRLTRGTPILMYHAFGRADEPPSRFILPVQRFARQMAWLRWMRYRVLSLEEFLCYRNEYRLPPSRSIVITIDDGYADNWTLAFPILGHYGFPATIFLVSAKIGGTNQWDNGSILNGRSLLSWSEIQQMLRQGIQFGAHTRTHTVLTSVTLENAANEIKESKRELEDKLGVPIHVFSYPYGEYNSTTQALAEQAGFWGSCSVDNGLNTPKTPVHALRRIEIWGTDSLIRFALAVYFGRIRRT